MARKRQPNMLVWAKHKQPEKGGRQEAGFSFETRSVASEELAFIQIAHSLEPKEAASLLRTLAAHIESNGWLLALENGERGGGLIETNGRILLGRDLIRSVLGDIARIVDGVNNRERPRAETPDQHAREECEADDETPACAEQQAPGLCEPA